MRDLGTVGAALILCLCSACKTLGGGDGPSSTGSAQAVDWDTPRLVTGMAGTQPDLADDSLRFGNWEAEAYTSTETHPDPTCSLFIRDGGYVFGIHRARGYPRNYSIEADGWDIPNSEFQTVILETGGGPKFPTRAIGVDNWLHGWMDGAPGLLDDLTRTSWFSVTTQHGVFAPDIQGVQKAVVWFRECERMVGTLVTETTSRQIGSSFLVKGWSGKVGYQENGRFRSCAVYSNGANDSGLIIEYDPDFFDDKYVVFVANEEWNGKLNKDEYSVTLDFGAGNRFDAPAASVRDGLAVSLRIDSAATRALTDATSVVVLSEAGNVYLHTYNADAALAWLARCRDYFRNG